MSKNNFFSILEQKDGICCVGLKFNCNSQFLDYLEQFDNIKAYLSYPKQSNFKSDANLVLQLPFDKLEELEFVITEFFKINDIKKKQ